MTMIEKYWRILIRFPIAEDRRPEDFVRYETEFLWFKSHIDACRFLKAMETDLTDLGFELLEGPQLREFPVPRLHDLEELTHWEKALLNPQQTEQKAKPKPTPTPTNGATIRKL